MRGVAPPRLRAAQAGISLVETLVALVLGLAMVSVAFNLYVSNRAVFRQIEAMVRLQESGSIAAALLETSIRHAAGTLCRNKPPTTTLLNTPSPTTNTDYLQHNPPTPYAYWQRVDGRDGGLLGLHGYDSIQADPIVGVLRLAGDSISIMSDNMGKVARVTGPATHTSASDTGGLTGSYTFTVDNGLDFPVGTVAMACDYARAVLFQVTYSEPTTITLHAGTGAPVVSPGNCAVTMRRPGGTDGVSAMDGDSSCYGGVDAQKKSGQIYPFGPGSMIGEHTFHHWYIGKKTSTDACCSLRRFRATYSATGVGSTDEEMVENVTDMQLTYLVGVLTTNYASRDYYLPQNDGTSKNMVRKLAKFPQVTAVRIVLTLTSPEKVGLAAQNKASAATYTIPINVAIRARMPGVVRR